jgi:hypothetical protein
MVPQTSRACSKSMHFLLVVCLGMFITKAGAVAPVASISCPVEGKTRVTPWPCTVIFSEPIASISAPTITNGAVGGGSSFRCFLRLLIWLALVNVPFTNSAYAFTVTPAAGDHVVTILFSAGAATVDCQASFFLII